VTSAPSPSTGSNHPILRSLLWVPTLYLAMGIPFNVINSTAASMYKDLGVSDSQITIALGSVIIAWSLKPLWAAFLDMYRTKKFFVITTELLLALLFTGVAMSLPLHGYFQISIAILWVAAFASSTQDICGDGIYLTSLDKKTQANLAGVQGMFWNLGKVLATGVLISSLQKLAQANAWAPQKMWMSVWITAAVAMAVFAIYHIKFLPPGSIEDRPHSAKAVWDDFLGSATTFFHKRAFWGMIAFVFLYRIGEGLILTEGRLFLQSSVESGGLGLTAGQVADIDAVYGTVAAISGGILGGMFLGKLGLKRALPILGLCLNVPHFTFVILSQYGASRHGLDYTTIATLVCIEKFGYGFGFIGNMVYMMQQIAPGRCTMTHYAFATALMNLMLSPTTMISGPLAEWLGFSTFFVLVMFASVPSVWAAWKAPHPLGDATRAKEGERREDEHIVTIDDPTRLTEAERNVQQIAGRASIYAMLNILTLLVVDAWALGQLRGLHGVAETTFFGIALSASAMRIFVIAVLGLSFALKVQFSLKTFGFASQAAAAAAPTGEKAYLGNARGAKITTILCGLVSASVLVVAYLLAN
jgi:PAT family beta-lactamase induction signal transducer AmpG